MKNGNASWHHDRFLAREGERVDNRSSATQRVCAKPHASLNLEHDKEEQFMNSSNDQRNRRILVIDDNRGIHNSFREILRGAASGKSALDEAEAGLFGETPAGRRTLGFTMESAYQGKEGIELVRAALDKGQPYAMAFVDMRMPPGM